MEAAAAEAAEDSSDLSDLDSPGDGSEVEDNFEDVWAVPAKSGEGGSGPRSRYAKPEDEGVVQYRRHCSELGCVPISYYELHYSEEQIVMNDHGIGGTGGVALAKSLAANTKATQVTLRTNALDEMAGKAMAAAFEANARITELDLFENRIQSVRDSDDSSSSFFCACFCFCFVFFEGVTREDTGGVHRPPLEGGVGSTDISLLSGLVAGCLYTLHADVRTCR